MSQVGVALSCLVFASSLVFARHRYGSIEQAYRHRWANPVEQHVGTPPYRVAVVRTEREGAPALVRVTAFLCAWIGLFVAVMGALAWLYRRPLATIARGGTLGEVVAPPPLLVHRFAETLLAREPAAATHAALAEEMLHKTALAFGLVALLGLLNDHAPVFFTTLVVIAVAMGAVSMLVWRTMRVHCA